MLRMQPLCKFVYAVVCIAAVDGAFTWFSGAPSTSFTSVNLTESNPCSVAKAYMAPYDDQVAPMHVYRCILSQTPDGGFSTKVYDRGFVLATPGSFIFCDETALRMKCQQSSYSLTVVAADAAGNPILTDTGAVAVNETWTVAVIGLPANC
ncbi:hypothetical protein DPMN_022100 [Dreissena polymorpha]|uniref:Uncharacterized protein n=1 Tax=Dreissena polymorpha TaxID=45954 RepID=A0A9D4NPX5_DREPO|nr:hypothetical protein DPMN_022100 [Dreissena polymorpha]